MQQFNPQQYYNNQSNITNMNNNQCNNINQYNIDNIKYGMKNVNVEQINEEYKPKIENNNLNENIDNDDE